MINSRKHILIYLQSAPLGANRKRHKTTQSLGNLRTAVNVEGITYKLINLLTQRLHLLIRPPKLCIQKVIVQVNLLLSHPTNSLATLVVQRVNLPNVGIIAPYLQTKKSSYERITPSINKTNLRVGRRKVIILSLILLIRNSLELQETLRPVLQLRHTVIENLMSHELDVMRLAYKWCLKAILLKHRKVKGPIPPCSHVVINNKLNELHNLLNGQVARVTIMTKRNVITYIIRLAIGPTCG